MRAGLMRERLAFQTVSRVSDGAGGYTETWTTSFTVWGRAKPLHKPEDLQQERITQNNIYDFTVRYTSSITPNMRVSWNSNTYRILMIMNIDEHKKWLTVRAKSE